MPSNAQINNHEYDTDNKKIIISLDVDSGKNTK